MSPRRLLSIAALLAGLLAGARPVATAADDAGQAAICPAGGDQTAVAPSHAGGPVLPVSSPIDPAPPVRVLFVASRTPAAAPSSTLPIYLRDRALRW